MDHNKHTYDGPLGKALVDPPGLGLCKAVLHHTGKQSGAMFCRCSKPFNELWTSSEIEVANACMMPFGYGIGNRCMFVLDVTLESMPGKTPTKIIHPA